MDATAAPPDGSAPLPYSAKPAGGGGYDLFDRDGRPVAWVEDMSGPAPSPAREEATARLLADGANHHAALLAAARTGLRMARIAVRLGLSGFGAATASVVEGHADVRLIREAVVAAGGDPGDPADDYRCVDRHAEEGGLGLAVYQPGDCDADE